MANRVLKDFSHYEGKEYGQLLVTKVLPRRYKSNGLIAPVEMECLCRACNQKVVLTLHTLQSRSSCGCAARKRSLLNELNPLTPSSEDKAIFARRSTDSYIAEKLNATYECKHTTEMCPRSSVSHICCCECDRQTQCGIACQNRPDKCGAKKRKKQ